MSLLLFQLDLNGGAPATPVPAAVTCPLPTVTVFPMRPLWVSESPTDTIMVTPNTSPTGSFQ